MSKTPAEIKREEELAAIAKSLNLIDPFSLDELQALRIEVDVIKKQFPDIQKIHRFRPADQQKKFPHGEMAFSKPEMRRSVIFHEGRAYIVHKVKTGILDPKTGKVAHYAGKGFMGEFRVLQDLETGEFPDGAKIQLILGEAAQKDIAPEEVQTERHVRVAVGSLTRVRPGKPPKRYDLKRRAPGDELSKIMNKKPLTEADKPYVALAEIFEVMRLNRMGICHRDLKESNMMCYKVPGSKAWIAEAIDFGLARRIDPTKKERIFISDDGTRGFMDAASAAKMIAPDKAQKIDSYSLARMILHVFVPNERSPAYNLGLEIKREFFEGHLAKNAQRILPIFATLGGILFPAFIFILINREQPETLIGWAIPTATDIAFAAGMLSLLGKGIPYALRIFLLSIAILDDLGAILIIGFFYAKDIAIVPLLLALSVFMVMLSCTWRNQVNVKIYLGFGIILWYLILKAGIHPTIAGVLTAITVPLKQNKQDKQDKSPLVQLETSLAPWVSYGILPLFAFANAGVSLANIHVDSLLEPLPLGIFLGLFLGKQLGVTFGTWLPIKLRMAVLPAGVSWRDIYGISLFCGIGFTMSMFIATLAFPKGDPNHSTILLSILLASIAAFVSGTLVLKYRRKNPKRS